MIKNTILALVCSTVLNNCIPSDAVELSSVPGGTDAYNSVYQAWSEASLSNEENLRCNISHIYVVYATTEQFYEESGYRDFYGTPNCLELYGDDCAIAAVYHLPRKSIIYIPVSVPEEQVLPAIYHEITHFMCHCTRTARDGDTNHSLDVLWELETGVVDMAQQICYDDQILDSSIICP